MFQRPLMQFFEGIVSIASHRKWGNLQGSSCSHSQDIPCSTLPVCESLQKEKQVMPLCPPRSKSSPELPAHCLHHHNIGQLWLLLQAGTPRLPGPDVDLGCRAVNRKLHTKLPVCPNPVNNTCQSPRKHPVQQNGLKQEQIKKPELEAISPCGIRKQYGTNQNLIARPGNSYMYSAGCQHESLPEFFHKLVTPTQLKRIGEARDLRQHWQLWIHVSGCIRN